MSFRWYCTPSSFPIQILQTGEKGFFPSFATCFLVSLSLSPPRPHTMTQPKSLLWLATVPKISKENRSLGGLGATAKWPPNHPTFRRALDNNRVVQDPSCPYIYKGRRAEQSTKKKEGRNRKEKKEESRAQKKTQKTKGKRRQRKKKAKRTLQFYLEKKRNFPTALQSFSLPHQQQQQPLFIFISFETAS